MKTKATVLAIALVLCALLSACANPMGSRGSPAVTAHASSYGVAPVMDSQGRLMTTVRSGQAPRRGNIFDN